MIPPTVLNVDDSEDDIVMLKAACDSTKVSFRFQSVGSGENALLYLQGATPYTDRERFPFPALLLLDLKMPGTSGFDVLQSIRASMDLSFQRLAIVVFTSSMHDEDATRAFELGADAYLVKPSDFNELRRIVTAFDSLLAGRDINVLDLRHLPDAKVAPVTEKRGSNMLSRADP